jgi:Ras-related protein Rab-1A
MKGRTQLFINNNNNKKDQIPEPERTEYDCLLKFKLLGDPGVGKTCLLLRFAENTFSDGMLSRNGDFEFKTIKVNDKTVKIQTWDVAGTERFRSKESISSHYRGSHAVICAFDLTDKLTFNSVEKILHEFSESEGLPSTIILVGTRCDQLNQRAVDDSEIQRFLASHPDIDAYVETSAKDNINVAAVFESAAKLVLEKRSPSLEGVKDDKNSETKTELIKSLDDKIKSISSSKKAESVKSQHKLNVLKMGKSYLEGNCTLGDLKSCMFENPEWDKALLSGLFSSTSKTWRLLNEIIEYKNESNQNITSKKP